MNRQRKSVEDNNEEARRRLAVFSEKLEERGYTFQETTQGPKLYRDGSSLYTHVFFDGEREEWGLERGQIRSDDSVFEDCQDGTVEKRLSEQFDWSGSVEVTKSQDKPMYRIKLVPDYGEAIDPELVEFIGAIST